MTDQTPDTIRALIERLERRADIEDVGTEETDAAYEDVPEVTWEEMREIVGLLREAASTLRALADQADWRLRWHARLGRGAVEPEGKFYARLERGWWPERCPDCLGRGVVGDYELDPARASDVMCRVCKGTGVAVAPAPTGAPPDGRAKAS